MKRGQMNKKDKFTIDFENSTLYHSTCSSGGNAGYKYLINSKPFRDIVAEGSRRDTGGSIYRHMTAEAIQKLPKERTGISAALHNV